MKPNMTILNISAGLFLLGCIIYTVINYSVLSETEGWGVVYMVGLFIFGSTAIIIDLLIQRFIKIKNHQTIVSFAVLAIYIVLFFVGR
jgi:uncharacterized PurR-regulated membrane protein YhhQ (DUF165 family)